MREQRRDRGQAIVLVLAAVVLIVVFATALARYGMRLADTQQVQLAADAAALAGVAGGLQAAERLAAANGGTLVEFSAVGDEVVVVVCVGDRTARARATRAP